MIIHAGFEVDPWHLCETTLDPTMLAHTESLFTLSNGHLGWRGNLDEGEPHGLPGSYLNGVYEQRTLPYAETAYGFPEAGETVVNVTNGKLIRLLVDDEPFDIRYGELVEHRRTLDWRDGELRRTVRWRSPTGRCVDVASVRLVSLTQRAVAAIRYEVTAVDEAVRVVVQSELVANEELPTAGSDPRGSAGLGDVLQSKLHVHGDTRACLVHTTRRSGLNVAVAMGHEVRGGDPTTEIESGPDLGRFTVTTLLRPGETLTMVKYIAHHWSSKRSLPAMRDQAEAALSAARQTGWDELRAQQRATLDEFWSHADILIDGDPEIQQAIRFSLFQLYQAGVRAEQRAIPAKGLTGNGYDGHAFWDTETFVLQVLTYTDPTAVANALRWRHSTLDQARRRAAQLGLAGAAFPWRTISGEECSGYWPASTAAFHINADIADAVARYLDASGDRDFDREIGTEMLVEIARLFLALGHFDTAGAFRITGVTGPDEYSALVDNNVYTNLMAQRALRAAADAAARNPDAARACRVRPVEPKHWTTAAEAMYVPYDEHLGVHPHSDGFLEHSRWDFDATPEQDYPLLLHYPYFDLYRKQVVKQADLVLAMQLCGEAFSTGDKVRNVDYYEAITVRDSSLSACSQSVLAAEVGHLRLAYDYLAEAALMDLADLEHNTADGLHLAALAGTWIALVAGFGGLRHHGDTLALAPRLPPGWRRLAFRVRLLDATLSVDISTEQAGYTLDGPQPRVVVHHGREITLRPGQTTHHPIPAVATRPAPHQPHGRAPAHRHPPDSTE